MEESRIAFLRHMISAPSPSGFEQRFSRSFAKSCNSIPTRCAQTSMAMLSPLSIQTVRPV